MSSPDELERIRNETLRRLDRNNMWFKVLFVITAALEWGGIIALVLLVDWSDRTHIVIFVAAMMVYLTLGTWTWALAARTRVGEQRIIRAIELLSETVAELGHNRDSSQVP